MSTTSFPPDHSSTPSTHSSTSRHDIEVPGKGTSEIETVDKAITQQVSQEIFSSTSTTVGSLSSEKTTTAKSLDALPEGTKATAAKTQSALAWFFSKITSLFSITHEDAEGMRNQAISNLEQGKLIPEDISNLAKLVKNDRYRSELVTHLTTSNIPLATTKTLAGRIMSKLNGEDRLKLAKEFLKQGVDNAAKDTGKLSEAAKGSLLRGNTIETYFISEFQNLVLKGNKKFKNEILKIIDSIESNSTMVTRNKTNNNFQIENWQMVIAEFNKFLGGVSDLTGSKNFPKELKEFNKFCKEYVTDKSDEEYGSMFGSQMTNLRLLSPLVASAGSEIRNTSGISQTGRANCIFISKLFLNEANGIVASDKERHLQPYYAMVHPEHNPEISLSKDLQELSKSQARGIKEQMNVIMNQLVGVELPKDKYILDTLFPKRGEIDTDEVIRERINQIVKDSNAFSSAQVFSKILVTAQKLLDNADSLESFPINSPILAGEQRRKARAIIQNSIQLYAKALYEKNAIDLASDEQEKLLETLTTNLNSLTDNDSATRIMDLIVSEIFGKKTS